MQNVEFVQEVAKWKWEELIAAHKFYSLEPNNKQAVTFCVLLERELVNRACAEADKSLNEHGIDTSKFPKAQ